jgi:hypothetical protein
MIKWKMKNRYHWHYEKGDIWDLVIYKNKQQILSLREDGKKELLKEVEKLFDVLNNKKYLEFIEND